MSTTSRLLGAGGAVVAGVALWAERRRLARHATTDDLTGLVNRREFVRIGTRAVEAARRSGSGLCLMMVDLDGFRQVNSALGHRGGDAALVGAAHRIAGAVRGTDVVGRWGGDEFVVLMPGLDDVDAVDAGAARIGDRLRAGPLVGARPTGASVGAAVFPRHGDTFAALLHAADLAMYRSKSSGVPYCMAVADDVAPGATLEGF